MMFIAILVLFALSSFSEAKAIIKRQATCQALWYNKCTSNQECCSQNCFKEPYWQFGVCKPGCQPLWYNHCKSHEECCSKNCNKQPDWAVGYCDKPLSTPTPTQPGETPVQPSETPMQPNESPDDNYDSRRNRPKNRTQSEPEIGEFKCGVPIAPKLRIIGGKSAARGEYPWQVSLQLREKDGNYKHACGGAILNQLIIVTAAHCVEGTPPEELRIAAGKVFLIKSESSESFHKVSKVIVHKTYDMEGAYSDDIALLKLMTPIQFDESKIPVCLPPPNLDVSGEVSATGWGSTQVRSAETTNADKLKVVHMNVIDRNACQSSYKRKTTITPKMLCAGAEGKDACQGDSGGPLTKKINGQHTLIGIVSFGIGCGRYPGIYTKVSKYIDWMQESANS